MDYNFIGGDACSWTFAFLFIGCWYYYIKVLMKRSVWIKLQLSKTRAKDQLWMQWMDFSVMGGNL